MGAWITLFGAIAGYGLWHWLRNMEEKALHNWGHARQEPSRPERLVATRIGSETAANSSEFEDVLVDSLDLLRLADPAIEEARLVAGNRDVLWSSIFPIPQSTVAHALASVAFRTSVGLQRRSAPSSSSK